jgi:phospholipase/lecithinase/hemolysin
VKPVVSRFILLALASASSLTGGTIDAIYAFGDSLTDVGNAFIGTGGVTPGAPYSAGRFSNGNIWIQDLAVALGLPAITPSLAGGTDYAVGGAESGNTTFHTAGLTDLPAQIGSYQGAHPSADPNSLYTIWVGSNDLADITSSNPAVVANDLGLVTNNIVSSIGLLAGKGAKNFLIVDVPDLGKTPQAIAAGASAAATESALAASFDYNFLIPAVSSIGGINLKVLDTYALVDGIVASPSTYGFSDVTDACLTGVNYSIFSGGTPCATPNTFLFWDRQHPTAATGAIISGAALTVITPEPSSMALGALGSLCLLFAGKRFFSRGPEPRPES